MIFVTVGAAVKGVEFDRLVAEMDRIAGTISEPVVMQIGHSLQPIRNAKTFSYVTFNEIVHYYQTAKLVVGHCGSGTVLNALRACVPLIVVPRLHEYGEAHYDNHQLQLAARLENRPGIRVVYKMEELEKHVKEMLAQAGTKPLYQSPEREQLFLTIRSFVESCL